MVIKVDEIPQVRYVDSIKTLTDRFNSILTYLAEDAIRMGTLNTLKTQYKSDLVGAINELVDTVADLDEEFTLQLDTAVTNINTNVDNYITTDITPRFNSLIDFAISTNSYLSVLSGQARDIQKEVAWLKLQQQASERIEGGKLFADGMDGTYFGLTKKTAYAELSEELPAGTTILNTKIRVLLNGYFTAGSKATIISGPLLSEEITITRSEVVNGVYYLECTPLVNSFPSTAIIAESTMESNGTFKGGPTRIVYLHNGTNVVTGGDFNTVGNSGRKIIRLNNGTLVTAVKNGTKEYVLYKSTDNGNVFNQMATIAIASTTPDISLATNGNHIFAAVLNSNTGVLCYSFNESGTQLGQYTVDSGQSILGSSISLSIRNGVAHATWSTKNATYTNSFNIRYSRATIASTGTMAWTSVTQVTNINTAGTNSVYPSIGIKFDGNPIIIYSRTNSSSNLINSIQHNGTTWGTPVTIYSGGAIEQTCPSVVVGRNGTIHVSWNTVDNTNTSNNMVYYCKSTDGTIWSASFPASGGSNTSITETKSGELFIMCSGSDGLLVKTSQDGGETWVTQSLSGTGLNPSTLVDFYSDIDSPIAVYMNPTDSSIALSGQWSEVVTVPRKSATARYEIPETGYVGIFVQKTEGVEVRAYLNGVLMDSELQDNEYEFIGITTKSGPSIIQLELSRTTTENGNEDRIIRILGGRS